jgi:phage-related tail protein
VQTCPYPELVERSKAIEADRREASGEVSRLREQIEAQRRVIQDCQYRAEKSKYKPHKQEYLERAKHREGQLAEMEAKLAQAVKRVAELDKQDAAIREQMLVP